MTGSRSGFDRRLEAIEARVIELFGMVAEDLPGATRALLDGAEDAARLLGGREQAVDALYLEAEELACREVLLQAPVGPDLRFLLSVLRVAPELERSHDLVMQVASRTWCAAGDALTPSARALVERMGEVAYGMWRDAADCWYARDPRTAPALGGSAEEMSQLHASLTAELARGQMAIPVTMEMTVVARCYERLGAHAVNIARRVAFLAGQVAG
jgi:phosphate transport system protein